MEIGEPRRKIVVEPVEDPVPCEEPEEPLREPGEKEPALRAPLPVE